MVVVVDDGLVAALGVDVLVGVDTEGGFLVMVISLLR